MAALPSSSSQKPAISSRDATATVYGVGWLVTPPLHGLRRGRYARPMKGVSLEQRLAGHVPPTSSRRVQRRAFAGTSHRGLRARIERQLDDAVQIFELDRLLYDIELDAQREWLGRLTAFDAYCARRDAAAGGPSLDPVR
jgi:hypothetical protein